MKKAEYLKRHKKKKAKKEKRKLRKQRRKNKGKQTPKWLTPELEKNLKWLARHFTRSRRYPENLQNKRFHCKKHNKGYCFTFTDEIKFCETCHAQSYCAKRINDIKCAEEW